MQESTPLNSTSNPPSSLVSIIIPTYNRKEFVGYSIKSALNQTYSNIEVIVVDDGSTDFTKEVIDKEFGGRVSYYSQENLGVSAARNHGIDKSTGDYVVFLDSDDILKPEMVEVSMNTLETLGEEFSVIASWANRIDSSGAPLPLPYAIDNLVGREFSSLDFLVCNRFGVTALVRRSSLVAIGAFDELLRASEDRELWIRIASQYRVYQLPEILYFIRRHGNNISVDGLRQSTHILEVFQKAKRTNLLQGWSRIFWVKIYSIFYFHRATMRDVDDFSGTVCDLMISILLWPMHSDWKALQRKNRFFRLRPLAGRCRRLIFRSTKLM